MTVNAGTIGASIDGAAAMLRSASSSPHRDAELLLSSVLKSTREALFLHRGDTLPARSARSFGTLVRRRAEGVPLPYLTRTREFYGLSFTVTPDVMIPRPETETLVEEAVRLLNDMPIPAPPARRTALDQHTTIVADIGTGSGAIAVSIAASVPRVRLVAADISPTALAVARRNARRHGVLQRMTLVESDLLREMPPDNWPKLLVANLPYVSSDELKNAGASPDTRGLTFEPARALDGGPDGLFVLRRLIAQLRNWPARPHLEHLCLEHNPGHARQLQELVSKQLPEYRLREVNPRVSRWTTRRLLP